MQRSPYRKAALALRNAAFSHEKSGTVSDAHTLHHHATLLGSTSPANHEASARMASRHETYLRDIISDAVHHNSSKVNSAKYHKSAGWSRLKEDAPVNAVGGGAIAGVGIGPNGEPPMRKPAMDKYRKRNAAEAPKAGRKTFMQFIQGK